MKFSTRVKPISYLKDHATDIVKDISESREPVSYTHLTLPTIYSV